MDEVTDPSLSVVAKGHQWYWSYEYPGFLGITVESGIDTSFAHPSSAKNTYDGTWDKDGSSRASSITSEVSHVEFVDYAQLTIADSVVEL